MAAENKKTGKVASVKIPTKQHINFAHFGETKINWIVATPAIIVIIILAALLSKVAVVDRFNKLSETRGQARRAQELQDTLYDQINSYGDINTEYAHYTYDMFTEDELSYVDRGAVFELLENKIMPKAEITSWSMSGNVLVLNIGGLTLDEVSTLSKELKTEDIVSYCMVSTAQTNRNDIDNVDRQDVTAVMTVYLQKPLTEEESEEDFEGGEGV